MRLAVSFMRFLLPGLAVCGLDLSAGCGGEFTHADDSDAAGSNAESGDERDIPSRGADSHDVDPADEGDAASVDATDAGDGCVFCESGSGCDASCKIPICQPLVVSCGPQQRQVLQCSADGFTQETKQDCAASSSVCVAGACVAITCQPGTRFCSGSEVRQCSPAGNKSMVVATCRTTEYCDGTTATCNAQVCTPNQATCLNNRATTCNADGSGYAAGTDCGKQSCSNGGCVAALFREDFEDGDTAGWTLGFPDAYTYSITPGTGANGSSRGLLFTKVQDTGYCCDGFVRVFSPPLQPNVVSWWTKAAQTGHEVGYFALQGGADSSGSVAYFDFYGTNMYLTASGGAPSLPYNANQWYHVELRDIDWQNHTFNYFVDGVHIGTTMTMGTPASSIARIDMFCGAITSPPSSVYYDEIEFR